MNVREFLAHEAEHARIEQTYAVALDFELPAVR